VGWCVGPCVGLDDGTQVVGTSEGTHVGLTVGWRDGP
jgi:hypothetical protein